MKFDTNLSSKVKNILRMARRLPRTPNLSDLRSTSELQAIIERECAIVDRHGNAFSLLVFDVGNTTLEVSIQHLVRILRCRVRSTDELGWLDGQRIGVVLPYTSSPVARKLADDICKLVASSASPPTYTVYSYPSQWLWGEGRNEGQQAVAVNPPEWQEEMLQVPSSFSKPTACGCTVFAVQPTTVEIHNCGQPVKRLEALFVCPLLPGWKRAMDIVGALAGLSLLCPLLLLIAVLIKIVSPGPVIFSQIRVGYLGKPFSLWKFRTMKLGANTSVHQYFSGNFINSDRPMTKLDMNNDPRIIPFGGILRGLGLDELPQLVNVLRGDMSLVGPRPCLPYEAQRYLLWQIRRFDAIPGLTGLWQVSGKNRTTFKEMIRLDITYARETSFWLDVKILLKTLPAIMVQFSDFFSVKRERDHSDAKGI